MGIRVECDWCRKPIESGMAYVTVEIDGKIVKGHHSNPATDVSGPARVYCGGDRYEDDDPAAAGQSLAAGERGYRGTNCAERVLAALNGNSEGRVDMGMEWRLVSLAAPHWERLTDGSVDLLKVEGRVIAALKKAGVTTIWDLARLTEAQWLAIPGIGRPRCVEIRKALYRHERIKGKELVEEEGLVTA